MDFENNTNNGDNTGVVIDIQKINCYIEDQFNKIDTTMKNKIELIHPQINFYYNSFNLCIGKQGCGKTTLIIKELYKLCTLPQNALYDTFIYVASGNDDETFNTLCGFLKGKLSMFYCTYDEIKEKFQEYIKAKNPEDIHHTFILFEDASFMFTRDNDQWNQWICKLRHLKCTVWANIHVWRSMNTMLKSQISTLFVFPGFSREQMQQMYRQSCVPIEFKSFFAIYCSCEQQQHQCFRIDNITQKVKVIN